MENVLFGNFYQLNDEPIRFAATVPAAYFENKIFIILTYIAETERLKKGCSAERQPI